MDIEDVKRRIDGLLKKAASTEHDAERKAFENKAMQLMMKWELTERDIKSEDPIKQHHIDTSEYGNFAAGVSVLICGIVDMNGGFPLFNTREENHRDRKGSKLLIYATDDCMDRSMWLVKKLFKQMEYHFVVAKASSRKSFSMAWAVTVCDRLKEAQAIVYSESGALVPVNTMAKETAIKAHGSFTSVNLGATDSTDEMKGHVKGSEADLMQSKINK